MKDKHVKISAALLLLRFFDRTKSVQTSSQGERLVSNVCCSSLNISERVCGVYMSDLNY
jgi:hypothetical protein